MRARQRGVALITAMLIVAIVATLATSLALGQQVWLRQTQNLVDLAQAERLRQGALEFAAAILARDAKNGQTSGTDNLDEDWAKTIPPLPVEGGAILISIADAQARLNLNNLIQPPRPGQAQSGGPSTDYVGAYRQLLTLLGLNPQLADALLDWMDTDATAQADGAEDIDYLNHDPPYRAANRPLTSVDELRLIKGYTEDVVEKLRPYVIVLPAPGQSPVNVNTASATVLAALTNTSIAQTEQIVSARANNPFKDVGQFQKLLPGKTLNPSNYAVTSGYFIVSVETRIGRTQRRSEALVERPAGGANVRALWYRQPAVKIVLDEDKA